MAVSPAGGAARSVRSSIFSESIFSFQTEVYLFSGCLCISNTALLHLRLTPRDAIIIIITTIIFITSLPLNCGSSAFLRRGDAAALPPSRDRLAGLGAPRLFSSRKTREKVKTAEKLTTCGTERLLSQSGDSLPLSLFLAAEVKTIYSLWLFLSAKNFLGH